MRFIKLLIAFGYSSLLAYLVFFARRRRHLNERFLNIIPVKNTLKNFVELDTNSTRDLYNYYSNLGGNIILFIPLPFIIASLFKKWGNKIILLIALGLSILIELTQYAFRIGVTDVDDILLNTLGALIGIVLLKISRKFCCFAF